MAGCFGYSPWLSSPLLDAAGGVAIITSVIWHSMAMARRPLPGKPSTLITTGLTALHSNGRIGAFAFSDRVVMSDNNPYQAPKTALETQASSEDKLLKHMREGWQVAIAHAALVGIFGVLIPSLAGGLDTEVTVYLIGMIGALLGLAYGVFHRNVICAALLAILQAASLGYAVINNGTVPGSAFIGVLILIAYSRSAWACYTLKQRLAA
ncbi:hypothetical protein [Leeia sp.]|uniref:hypothetical protein n=1 Tax=Leeia sp. TaxID=2884678 RepID=UPI0035AD9135